MRFQTSARYGNVGASRRASPSRIATNRSTSAYRSQREPSESACYGRPSGHSGLVEHAEIMRRRSDRAYTTDDENGGSDRLVCRSLVSERRGEPSARVVPFPYELVRLVAVFMLMSDHVALLRRSALQRLLAAALRQEVVMTVRNVGIASVAVVTVGVAVAWGYSIFGSQPDTSVEVQDVPEPAWRVEVEDASPTEETLAAE